VKILAGLLKYFHGLTEVVTDMVEVDLGG